MVYLIQQIQDTERPFKHLKAEINIPRNIAALTLILNVPITKMAEISNLSGESTAFLIAFLLNTGTFTFASLTAVLRIDPKIATMSETLETNLQYLKQELEDLALLCTTELNLKISRKQLSHLGQLTNQRIKHIEAEIAHEHATKREYESRLQRAQKSLSQNK